MSRKFSKELNEKIDRDLDEQIKSKRRRNDREPPEHKKSKSSDKKEKKDKKKHSELHPKYVAVEIPHKALKSLLRASGLPSDCKGMKLQVKLSIPEKKK